MLNKLILEIDQLMYDFNFYEYIDTFDSRAYGREYAKEIIKDPAAGLLDLFQDIIDSNDSESKEEAIIIMLDLSVYYDNINKFDISDKLINMVIQYDIMDCKTA